MTRGKCGTVRSFAAFAKDAAAHALAAGYRAVHGRRSSRAECRGASSGAALLLVLWIIGLLGIITVSFAWDAYLEGRVVSFARKRAKAEALAQSGIEIAKMLLDKSNKVNGEEDDDEVADDEWYMEALSLFRGGAATLTREIGDGVVRVDIEPVGGGFGRNVNKFQDEDWERVFQNVLGLPEDYWPELIDSFRDWIDEDDIPSENGGETDDYYSTLDKPYTAKNGPLDTVEELLLIKGFSKAILYGGVLNPEDPEESHIVISNGLARLLTTFGDGKVNVNAVPDGEVGVHILTTLPGVDELGARAILEERSNPANAVTDEDFENTSFKDEADFMSRIGNELDDNSIANFVSVKSQYFRVTSVGQIDRVTRRVWAIVYADGKTTRFLRWREEP